MEERNGKKDGIQFERRKNREAHTHRLVHKT